MALEWREVVWHAPSDGVQPLPPISYEETERTTAAMAQASSSSAAAATSASPPPHHKVILRPVVHWKFSLTFYSLDTCNSKGILLTHQHDTCSFIQRHCILQLQLRHQPHDSRLLFSITRLGGSAILAQSSSQKRQMEKMNNRSGRRMNRRSQSLPFVEIKVDSKRCKVKL